MCGLKGEYGTRECSVAHVALLRRCGHRSVGIASDEIQYCSEERIAVLFESLLTEALDSTKRLLGRRALLC